MHYITPSVYRLQVHLPGMQNVTWNEDTAETLNEIVEQAATKETTLIFLLDACIMFHPRPMMLSTFTFVFSSLQSKVPPSLSISAQSMVRSSPPSKKHVLHWDSFQMTMNVISVFRRQVRWQLGINSGYSLSLFSVIAFLQLQHKSGKTTMSIFAMISNMIFSLQMKMSGTMASIFWTSFFQTPTNLSRIG